MNINRVLFIFLLACCLVACRQDMHDQPKYEPLEFSTFFDDGRSSRPLVEGTVPRGFLKENELLYTGKRGNTFVDEFPFPVTDQIMKRGQERYNIFCVPCHDSLGNGFGMVVRRGFKRPPSFHLDRLRTIQNGFLYDVITNGFGAMAGYAEQIPVEDRWAIVAYIRALQLSQNARIEDVPEPKRSELISMRQPQ